MKDNKDIETFFRTQNSKLGKCLYPFFECNGKPILAHSIQNSGTFDLLQSDNHLIQLKHRFNGLSEPSFDFVPVGRNEASTFLGLCSIHDNSLFAPIDKNELNFENPEHAFLLAYRALLKEYYAVMTGFIKIQNTYQQKGKSGLVPGENFSKEMAVIEWGIKAYNTYTYKEKYDLALKDRNFEFLRHRLIEFKNQQPSIACSQIFSADSFEFEDDVLRIGLNIIPTSLNTTIVMFSSSDKEFVLANAYLQRCLEGDDNFKKYEISKLVIRNCENFFINPHYFYRWTSEKKKRIVSYFLNTFKSDHDEDAIEYYLFENEA